MRREDLVVGERYAVRTPDAWGPSGVRPVLVLDTQSWGHGRLGGRQATLRGPRGMLFLIPSWIRVVAPGAEYRVLVVECDGLGEPIPQSIRIMDVEEIVCAWEDVVPKDASPAPVEEPTVATPAPGPYAICLTCDVQHADREAMIQHGRETLTPTGEKSGVVARGHSSRVVNPTPEEKERDRVRSLVSSAIEGALETAFDDLERSIERGYVTEVAVTAELRVFPDFADAWDVWRKEAEPSVAPAGE